MKSNLLIIIVLTLMNVWSVYGQSRCQRRRLNEVKNGSIKAQGSNLGSWFVIEAWMSPQPWIENGCNSTTDAGQYLLESCLGNISHSVMDKHWSTFITERDFVKMSTHGINLMRIPVGWWTVLKIL
jgi:aryl-phospho-beta-D-glucosidase BglC (GH1 family)